MDTQLLTAIDAHTAVHSWYINYYYYYYTHLTALFPGLPG